MTRKLRNLLAAGLFVLFVLADVYGQQKQEITPELRQQANELFTAQNWTKAIEAYQTISRLEPENANALYRIGFSLHNLKQYKRAIEFYERSEKLATNQYVTYNLGCAYALAGEKEKAFWWLEKAISNGFTNVKHFQTDVDLESLQGTKEFKALEEKMDRASRPCEFKEQARQFDFWVGDWEVQNQQGGKAGNNTIQKLEKGCILLENWTSASGSSGKSINFFDAQSNKWRQVWVDSRGNSTAYVGEFKDGAMRYEAGAWGKDGKKVLLRLTFTPLEKGRIRQHGERSADEGKTWSTDYDLIYILKTSAAK